MIKFTVGALREFFIYVLCITAILFLGLFSMSNRYELMYTGDPVAPFARLNKFTGEVCGYLGQIQKWVCLPHDEYRRWEDPEWKGKNKE